MGREPAYLAPVPVVCIGNFTVGGTGKTPLALHVGKLLAEKGERPAFLTRGYGGRLRGPHVVSRGIDTAREVGDEALLLSALYPTCVARDRAAGARHLLERSEAPSIIIMDDGLQNPSIGKDLVLAVVDAGRGFGNGRVIPAGPLRAPLEAQIAVVGAIVMNAPPSESDTSADSGSGEAELRAMIRSRFPGPVLSMRPKPREPLEWLREGSWIAYAGIGNPERFFSMLRGLGCDLIHARGFSDHHAFDDRDAVELTETARSVRAGLVTTEKDMARLIGASGRRLELAECSRTVGIDVQFSDADRLRLSALLDGILARRRRASRSHSS